MSPIGADARLRYQRSAIPTGRSGEWAIERFEINDHSHDATSVDSRAEWARAQPGHYTRLRCGGIDFMTDLYEEWWSQRQPMVEALERGGDILVTGLGLGMIAETILRVQPSTVATITVIEASGDVIALVGPHLSETLGARLRIEHADAFEWVPRVGASFTLAWHDIWASPFAQRSAQESYQLIERYSGFCEWQGSWALDYRSLAGLDS